MNSDHLNTFHTRSVDPTILSRALTTALLFVITVVLGFHAVKSGNRSYMAAVVALPFALMLMNMPLFSLVLVLIMNATNLPMPGFHAAKLGVMFQLIMIGTYFLSVALGRQQWRYIKTAEGKLVIWYGLWLIVLIAVRGAGLRSMGSTTWGGQRYIIQFVSILFFFVLTSFRLGKKHIRWIVWGSLFAGAIGSLIAWKTGDSYSAVENANEVSKSRLTFLAAFFAGLFPVIFTFRPKRVRVVSLLLLFLAIGVNVLMGFRHRLVALGMVLFLYGYFKAKNKIQYIMGMFALGMVLWAIVVALSPFLPMSMQRTISFVPGANIAVEVSLSTDNSSEWRFELWKYALTQANQYFLVGRGMTIDVLDVLAKGGVGEFNHTSTWFMFQTHSYHSGPVALLIDLGIPGMIIYILFSGYALKRLWGYAVRLARLDSFESRFALFGCVNMLWTFIAFYLVFGSVGAIGVQIFSFAVVSLIATSVLDMHNKQELEQSSFVEEAL